MVYVFSMQPIRIFLSPYPLAGKRRVMDTAPFYRPKQEQCVILSSELFSIPLRSSLPFFFLKRYVLVKPSLMVDI